MSGKAVRETLGFLAVVAGLLFVGLEIQQSNVQARAAARQALAETSIGLNLARASGPRLDTDLNEWVAAGVGETLDCNGTSACRFVFAVLRYHENVFIQVMEGVLDESALESYSYREAPIYDSPLFAQYWPTIRRQFDPDFVAAFEPVYDLAP